MASNINPNNIDGAYPVAGQDNDSQGFRDNFTNIKTSMQFAKEEIEALQNSAVTLTGTNNMSGGVIVGAQIQDIRETRVALPTGSAILTLDHAYGHYYSVTSSSSMQVAFAGWPATGVLGRVKLEVTISNITDTLQLPASVMIGVSTILGYNSSTRVITFDEPGVYIFEFMSHDGGNTFSINDLTRIRNIGAMFETVAHATSVNATQDANIANLSGQIGVINNNIVAIDGDIVALQNALAAKANTSSLSAVATSGSYSDLSGVPALSAVATSGAYSDLSGVPSMPLLVSVPATSIGQTGDNVGMMAVDTTNLYVCIAAFDGTTAIWKQLPLVAF